MSAEDRKAEILRELAVTDVANARRALAREYLRLKHDGLAPERIEAIRAYTLGGRWLRLRGASANAGAMATDHAAGVAAMLEARGA